ncbi:hypothetical protein EDD22DRAFT_948788 [Suillus occidentalis]|nr:hypothetical protein EDD22DRAFT_948788 [Suillus occidentalis]
MSQRGWHQQTHPSLSSLNPNYDHSSNMYHLDGVAAQQPNIAAYSQELASFHATTPPLLPTSTPLLPTSTHLLPASTPADSSQSGLGASGLNVLDSTSESVVNMLGQRRKMDDVYPEVVKQQKFLGSRVLPTSIPTGTSSKSPMVFVSFSLIKDVKANTWEHLMKTLFEKSLFPSQLQLSSWANDSLDHVVSSCANKEIMKWKLRSEGKREIKRLKGIVKSIQNSFDNFNQVFIIGVYDIAL